MSLILNNKGALKMYEEKNNAIEISEANGYHLLLLKLNLIKGGTLSVFIGVTKEKRDILMSMDEVTAKDINEKEIILTAGSDVTEKQKNSAIQFFLRHFINNQNITAKYK